VRFSGKKVTRIKSFEDLIKIFPRIILKEKVVVKKPVLLASPQWAKEWKGCGFIAQDMDVGAK
jgi:hypothetical protein